MITVEINLSSNNFIHVPILIADHTLYSNQKPSIKMCIHNLEDYQKRNQ